MTRSHPSSICPKSVLRQFSESEAQQLADAWLSVFGQNRRGLKTEAYMWHVFSANSYPCVDGAEAIRLYKEQIATELIVLSNDRKFAILTSSWPESLTIDDYYIFPPNYAWTVAFTHEDGWLGPYFAMHPDFVRLAKENERKQLKRMEMEEARRKRYC